MPHVVVTGGLGFIGSHLCAALAGRGYEVTAVDDLSAAHARASAAPRFRTAIARAEHAAALDLLDGTDAIVHLAAVPGVRTRVGSDGLTARNVNAVETLGRAAAARRIRLVLASTSSVYGDANVLPTPERAPYQPLNPYARSKVAAERVCLNLVREGADIAIARLFTVFGPGQRPDMAFSRWIDCLMHDRPLPWCAPRRAARELTHVSDAARGLIAVLERGRPGHAYNVAGCGSVEVRTALRELEALTGREARLEPLQTHVREAVVTAACGEKAASQLGYAPATTLVEGLRQQVARHSARAAGERRPTESHAGTAPRPLRVGALVTRPAAAG